MENDTMEKPALLLSLLFSVLILLLHGVYQFADFEHPLFMKLWLIVINTGLFEFFHKPHLLALVFAMIYALGTKGMKSESVTFTNTFFLLLFGMALYFGAYFALILPGKIGMFAYIGILSTGYLLLLTGLIHIRRIITNNLMKDQFNKKNKLFRQEVRKVENPYSINIKTEDGWLNIVNPFRATMVLGTPGSGKSYTIVEEYIKQHIQKGFAMLVYDFKYPDLSKVAYNYFLKYHHGYSHRPSIFMVNFDEPMNSHRVNPIAPILIQNQADALATSEALFLNINKEYIKKKDFFTSSAVNLVAAIIWFLRSFEQGKYCTIPHVIGLLSLSDEVLFSILEKQTDIKPLLSPFADALSKEAYEQLSGQTASARIPLSRLATKELFWILSGNDVALDINNPDHPALLFLANNPQTQKSYGAIFGLLASTITRIINKKNRLPLSLIIDELPTIYINGLDNLIATARSNKISTLLSFQDLAQLERDYGREVANAIFNTVGNKITGSVVAETAKKLSDMIGKTIQQRANISYSKRGTTTGKTTTLDYLIPPETIAQLSQGEFCGVLSDTYEQKAEQKIFYSKVLADKSDLTRHDIPALNRVGEEQFNHLLQANFLQIDKEVKYLVNTFLAVSPS